MLSTPRYSIDEADLEGIFQATTPLWEEMQGEQIFITGGTGFFGAWLLESFAYSNRKLCLNAGATVLSREPDAFRRRAPHLTEDGSIAVIGGDVRSFAFPNGRFKLVIHAATDASAWLTANRPKQMLNTIVQGTERVLAFAEQAGTSRMLMISSGAVYGKQPFDLQRLDETWHGAPDPTHPASVYGEGKRLAELLCALSAKPGFEINIARCFAFVGPHLPLDRHFAVGNFLADALSGRDISIRGDGASLRSYLYASDLAVWLWTILMRGHPLRPYNVGSEEEITVKDLAHSVALLNPACNAVTLGIDRSAPTRYIPSTARAAGELGLKQTVALPDALRRTYTWNKLKSTETAH